MDKLELKHLAPYLPYGLKIRNVDKNIESKYGIEILSSNDLRQSQIDIWNKYNCTKPILRPLSDLIKPVLTKGLYKIPLVVLKNGGTDLNTVRVFEGDYSCIDNEEHETIYSTSDMSFYQRYRGETISCRGQHEKFQRLFEWHFDVFGLIDSGLAIDINTLKDEK